MKILLSLSCWLHLYNIESSDLNTNSPMANLRWFVFHSILGIPGNPSLAVTLLDKYHVIYEQFSMSYPVLHAVKLVFTVTPWMVTWHLRHVFKTTFWSHFLQDTFICHLFWATTYHLQPIIFNVICSGRIGQVLLYFTSLLYGCLWFMANF